MYINNAGKGDLARICNITLKQSHEKKIVLFDNVLDLHCHFNLFRSSLLIISFVMLFPPVALMRTITRPSEVQADLTFVDSRAKDRSFWFSFVKSSAMTMPDPFNFFRFVIISLLFL